MNAFSIVASLVALFAVALTPTSALAQCCGGGGHAQHGGGQAQHALPQATHAQQVPVIQPPSTDPSKRPKLPVDPVTGQPIDFSFKAMTDDGPVYFSSAAASKRFNENPEAYAEKVNEQRAALAKMTRVQVNCPVTGNPIDVNTFVYTEGQGIYFCCQKCPPKYDPAKYQAALAGSYTYQMRCPVDGETIDPTAYTDLPTGQRIYFCCKGDVEKFAKEPAKYAPRLAAQGISIDAPKPSESRGRAASSQPVKAKAESQAHDHRSQGHAGMVHP